MITLQEQFEKDFPDKSVKEIRISDKYKDSNFTNYDLDLREYVNLSYLYCGSNNLTSLNLSSGLIDLFCHSNKLTSLNLSGLDNLIDLTCYSNNLTSVDFLKLNPEKLERLRISKNK